MADEEKEITSLNKELMSLDFSDVTVEELERRLELAVAFFDAEPLACPSFNCGRTFDCTQSFGCSTF